MLFPHSWTCCHKEKGIVRMQWHIYLIYVIFAAYRSLWGDGKVVQAVTNILA